MLHQNNQAGVVCIECDWIRVLCGWLPHDSLNLFVLDSWLSQLAGYTGTTCVIGFLQVLSLGLFFWIALALESREWF